MTTFSLGLTPVSACSYLPEQAQQLLMTLPQTPLNYEEQNLLVENGFRRNGSVFYRPRCPECQACESLRVDVNAFTPSRNHRRLLRKTAHFTWKVEDQLDENWFDLYARYITVRHAEGTMFPPNADDFLRFIESTQTDLFYLHAYEEEQLVAVAVTDKYHSGLSALYTFYDPGNRLTLGTRCILKQIELAQKMHTHWLYLGFQVDDCPAMRYKCDFLPHQRFKQSHWQASNEKPAPSQKELCV